MTSPPFRVAPLDLQHDRAGFDCGVDALNEYFRAHVGQDIRRRVSFCYVATENQTNCIAGYYTLAACGVAVGDLPAHITKRLPRYPMVPAVRIGRLAVDRRFRGRGLGGALLFDAINRTCQSGIGAFAVIVDAKDDAAVAFYQHHGFQRLSNAERTLFLPISAALKQIMQAPR